MFADQPATEGAYIGPSHTLSRVQHVAKTILQWYFKDVVNETDAKKCEARDKVQIVL